jgi:polyisoprenoid-binding protein YceI
MRSRRRWCNLTQSDPILGAPTMVLFLSPRRSIIKAATAGLMVLIASSAWATTFELDSSHSEVGFRVHHFTVSWTRGRFDVFSGTLNLDEKDVNKRGQ